MADILIIGKNSLIIEGIIMCLSEQKYVTCYFDSIDYTFNEDFDIKYSKDDVKIIICYLPVLNNNNIKFLIKIKKYYSSQKILLIINLGVSLLHHLQNIGIHGLLLDTTTKMQLKHALDSINHGDIYISEEAKKIFYKNIFINPDKANINDSDIELKKFITHREKEILKYLAEGYKTKEISEKLNICKDTVNFHRKNLLSKLNNYGVKNTPSALINK
ncbi:response regulator transcription factor [Candidatus Babeliales bacterium]|nr:response regulator transcription factor [Candidatus Babeliales bacterium]